MHVWALTSFISISWFGYLQVVAILGVLTEKPSYDYNSCVILILSLSLSLYLSLSLSLSLISFNSLLFSFLKTAAEE